MAQTTAERNGTKEAQDMVALRQRQEVAERQRLQDEAEAARRQQAREQQDEQKRQSPNYLTPEEVEKRRQEDTRELTDLWFHPRLGTTRYRDGKPWENEADILMGFLGLLEKQKAQRLRDAILAPGRDRYQWFSEFKKEIAKWVAEGYKRREERQRLTSRLEQLDQAENPSDPKVIELRDSLLRSLALIDAVNKAEEAQPETVRAVDEWEPPIPLAEIPEADGFPLDVLPRTPRMFVEQLAEAMSCPPDFAAVPAMAIAGAAIGATRAVKIKQDYFQAANLYAAVIGRPGRGKSPSLEKVAAPVYDRQMELLAEFRKRLADWESARRSGGEPASFNGEGAINGASDPPTLRKLWCQNVTGEQVISLLNDNPRGIIMIQDELAALMCGMDAYRNGKGADKQMYQSLWNRSAMDYERKGQKRGPLSVRKPFLSICGGTQPDMLPLLRGEVGKADGWLDRVLLSFPVQPKIVGETWKEVEEDVTRAWEEKLKFLWAFDGVPSACGTRPLIMRFQSGCRDVWEDFTNDLAKQMDDDSFPPFLEGPWLKLRVYCVRLALIVHCLRLADGEKLPDGKPLSEHDLDGESLLRGVRLVSYFQSHARKVYGAMDADRETESAKRLLAWIVREGRTEFKRWEPHRDLRSVGRFPTPESLNGPLERLRRHNYIRVKDPMARPGPGRPPAPVFEVNPVILQDHRVNNVNRVNSPAEGQEADLHDLHDLHDGSREEEVEEEDDLSPDVTLDG